MRISSIAHCSHELQLTQVPLSERRALLRTVLKPSDHVALSEVSERTAAEMLKFVKSHGLESVVAKRSEASISLDFALDYGQSTVSISGLLRRSMSA